MAKQPTEDEQNLKRKARRRLVGAFALTLAVVVILPMVLDGEPKPTGQDIDLRIPAPDKAGEFAPKVIVPKEQPVELPASSVVLAPAVAPEMKTVEPKESVKKSLVEKATQPIATEQKKAMPPKGDAKPATKETNSSVSVQSYVAQVGAYTNAESAKQTLADLKKWSFKAYSEKSGDKIRVRVGPYAEREKVEKVIVLLEKHGLHPVVVSLP